MVFVDLMQVTIIVQLSIFYTVIDTYVERTGKAIVLNAV
jgi:hypothetical protein